MGALRCVFSVVSICIVMFGYVFVFQAEDGIRDLVRSRGLGDVYKRQNHAGNPSQKCRQEHRRAGIAADAEHEIGALLLEAVSYTHLTLPTSDLV